MSVASSPSPSTTDHRADMVHLWGQVLSADTGLDPSDAVMVELSEFFDMPLDRVRTRCDNSKVLTKEEWLAGDRDTPEGLIDYWNLAGPVFGITNSHAKQYHGVHPASSVELALGLADLQPGRMLDFGVGPGTNAMFFHELGWQVTMSDISTVMLDFAKWRAERRNIDATYLDTRTEPLPPETFDLVMALEVMHVVPDVDAVLHQLRNAMRPGATLVFNVFAPPKGPESFSYLYEASWPVLRKVRKAGFKRRPRIRHYYRYERVERGPWATRAIAGVDLLRYNRYVTMVGNRVRQLRARRAAR